MNEKAPVKNVRYVDNQTFQDLMRKILKENAEAIKRLAKK